MKELEQLIGKDVGSIVCKVSGEEGHSHLTSLCPPSTSGIIGSGHSGSGNNRSYVQGLGLTPVEQSRHSKEIHYASSLLFRQPPFRVLPEQSPE